MFRDLSEVLLSEPEHSVCLAWEIWMFCSWRHVWLFLLLASSLEAHKSFIDALSPLSFLVREKKLQRRFMDEDDSQRRPLFTSAALLLVAVHYRIHSAWICLLAFFFLLLVSWQEAGVTKNSPDIYVCRCIQLWPHRAVFLARCVFS